MSFGEVLSGSATCKREAFQAASPYRQASVLSLTFAIIALMFASPAHAESDIVAWFDDPWRATNGGTDTPGDEELARPWRMRACRNDTEQAFIGLMARGDEPVDVTVSIETDFPSGAAGAELLVAGSIRSRLAPDGALVNLFTADQLKTFADKFPKGFVNADQMKDFPTLHLKPDAPVWIWLRVRTSDADGRYEQLPPGSYQLTFTAGYGEQKLQRVIELQVLPVVLPVTPVLEAFPYGGVEEKDDRLHHTTVSGGWKRYVWGGSLYAVTGAWGRREELTQLFKTDPVAFQREIQLLVDKYLKRYRDRGYREDQILVEVSDEPSDGCGSEGALFLKTGRAVKRYRPDLKTLVNPAAHWERTDVTLDGTFRPLDPITDIWMPFYEHYENPAVRQFLRETGKPLWCYRNCTIQDARREGGCLGWLRRAGWFGVRHDLEGIGFWSATSSYGDMWDDFDIWGSIDWADAAVVFPSKAGPITTRQWEAWRETLEDAAIYKMLQRTVDAGLIPSDQVEAAKRWLEDSPNTIWNMDEKDGGRVLRKVLDEALNMLAASGAR